MKIAIVHDWIVTNGGAEKVLRAILDIYPDADIFSLVDFLEEEQRNTILNGKNVQTSFIQKLPLANKYFRNYLPLFPKAIESFNLKDYDLIISSSWAVAKGINKHSNQLHICYCHTPIRYAWDLYDEYTSGLKQPKKFLVQKTLEYIRKWDIKTLNRVDYFVANSNFVAHRIKKTYGQDSVVIYPPVDTKHFVLNEKKQDYYLTACRLVPYKKTQLIVEAFNKMPNKKLFVIGDGEEYTSIKKIAKSNITLLGYQEFESMIYYMQNARAFVYAAIEDFGIVSIEAMSCGTPVIALNNGSTAETIEDKITGMHFNSQVVDDIVDAVKRFETMSFDSKKISNLSNKYNEERFKTEFESFVLKFSMNITIYLRVNYFQEILPVFQTNEVDKYGWIIAIIFLTFVYENIYFIRYDYWGDLKRIIKGLFFAFVAVMTVITLSKMSLEYSRSFLALFFIISLLLLTIIKRYTKRLLFLFDIFKINVKVVAKGEQFDKISKEISDNWYFGFKQDESQIDMVLIGSKKFKTDELQKLIKQYSKLTKDIFVVPYMDHLDFTHATIVDYSNIRLSAIHLENRLFNLKSILLKNIFEKFLVVVAFPFMLLVHIFLYLLIKFDSPGPIFFKQKRYGKDAKPFSCYKYRTMYVENDIILKDYLEKYPEEIEYYNTYHKYKNDPRITKIGKFLRKTSLDEFPQFYNILRGDMNLIGPRPYMLNEKEKIGKAHEEIILEVKPGITGLWQVSGRNDLTFQERLELDKWYIQNWSLWLDFVIFVKTIKVVLSKVGAK